ncbi:MAG: PPC domain-containing protein [Planctomycetales bacterium]
MDAKGKELAYCDDTPGLGGDSRLVHQFAADGEYLLEIRDIRFQGGDQFKYRLRIGEFPTVSVPYPLSAPMGETTTVSFTGSDVTGVSPASLNIPAATQSRWMNVGAKYDKGTASAFATLGISHGKEFLEQEPNDEAPQANKVPMGQSLNGRFEKVRDVDRFTFTAKKGESYLFQAYTHAQGSPADLRMRLLKADGNQVAASEELNPAQDGRIQFSFPEDGNYTLVVNDVHGRGGPEYAYRVEIKPATSPVELSTSADTINISQEGIALLTVTAKRNGFGGPIPLRLSPSIEGVRITNAEIPPGKETAIVTLLNEGGLPQGKCLNVRLVADIPDASGKPVAVIATVSASLRTSHNAIPHPPAVLSEEFALGVSPRPAYVLRSSNSVTLGKGLTGTLKVKALRTADFNEPITLEVFPKEKGLPDGVTIALKPIDKDQNVVELAVSGTDKAPLGVFHAVIQGTAKRGNETIVQPVAAIELHLKDAFTLKDAPAGKIAPGGELKIPVQIDRNPVFKEPVTVTVANLPAGVTAAALTIPADASSGILTLTATKETGKGAPAPLKLKVEGTANKVKHEKTIDLKLTVE